MDKQPPSLNIDGRLFVAPYFDVSRPLSRDELADLKASIRKHGIRHPVLVDGSAGIAVTHVLDGWHRLQVAKSLGLGLDDIPFKELEPGLSDDEKRALAAELNEARRQLSREEIRQRRKERIARAAELRRRGTSLRTIAEREDVSLTQVSEDLKAATVQGLTVEAEGGRVNSRDGRSRPAKGTPRKVPTPSTGGHGGNGHAAHPPSTELPNGHTGNGHASPFPSSVVRPADALPPAWAAFNPLAALPDDMPLSTPAEAFSVLRAALAWALAVDECRSFANAAERQVWLVARRGARDAVERALQALGWLSDDEIIAATGRINRAMDAAGGEARLIANDSIAGGPNLMNS